MKATIRGRLACTVFVTFAMSLGAVPAAAQESKPPSLPTTSSDEPVAPPIAPAGPAIGEVQLSVDGKNVDAAPVGSVITMKVQLVGEAPNSSSGDVSLDLKPAGRGIDLTESSADYKPYDPAGTTRAFHFVLNQSGCPTDIVAFEGTVHSSAGDIATKLAVPADCPGPRLIQQSVRYEGGDGDGVPEPGERLQLFVTLQNLGHDAATDISGVLTISSGDVTVLDGTSTWPNIAAGGAGENKTSFVIDISKDAKQSPCGNIGVDLPAVGGSGSSPGFSGEGGSVSSDGSVVAEPAGSSGPVAVEPAPADSAPDVVPAGSASTAPGTIEPGIIEPAPSGTEPPPADAPVDFQGDITLTASGQTLHADVFSGNVRELGLGAPQAPAGGVSVADRNALAAESAKTTSGTGSAYLIVVLVAAAGALVARYGFNA